MSGGEFSGTPRLDIHVEAPAPAAPEPLLPADSAEQSPVARVLVDTGLAHLDRPFEYAVPAQFADQARPGVRVKVRFAGKDCDGFLLERTDRAEHAGRLTSLRRVVSDEPVLDAALLRLCEQVARRYAGTVGDVLRLAVPLRHARAEKALPRPEAAADASLPELIDPDEVGTWGGYHGGAALVRRVRSGGDPAAAWQVRPGIDAQEQADAWADGLALLAAHALSAGRGVLLLVPDAADLATLRTAVERRVGAQRFVTLSADRGVQARWTAWLKARRGAVRCVIGTRAAAFAPVADLGLICCWDDGDDSYLEPRAPYPHTREVLAIRARDAAAAFVLGGYTRSVQVQAWVETGAVRPVEPQARTVLPVHVAGEGVDEERYGAAARAHLPATAWTAASRALQTSPVLVQVPRRGYLLSLACADCRTPVRCPVCAGPVVADGDSASCRWCSRVVPRRPCAVCGSTRTRANVIGATRTAEEIGRAFPGVPVLRADAEHHPGRVPHCPAVVVATPGSEPAADGGYGAVLLLDAWALLERPALDAQAEALRRWAAAAALVRVGDEPGRVVLGGAPPHGRLPAVEALVRWAPGWFAARELADRAEAGQPPAVWTASLTGPESAVTDALATLDLPSRELPDPVQVLGPMLVEPTVGGPPVPEVQPSSSGAGPGRASEPAQVRALLRTDHRTGPVVAQALRELRSVRSAGKAPGTVSIRVDPDPRML